MPAIQSTSVRSRQVPTELRRPRETAGLTGADVARTFGMSPSKVSRIGTGNRGLQVGEVAVLLGLYRVAERRREEILALVRKSDAKGWWQSQGSGLPELWKSLIDFESRATRIQNCEAAVVPGLLQTADYPAAVIQGINRAITDSGLDNLVASGCAAVLAATAKPAIPGMSPTSALSPGARVRTAQTRRTASRSRSAVRSSASETPKIPRTGQFSYEWTVGTASWTPFATCSRRLVQH